MRHPRFSVTLLLAACLVCSWSFLRAAAPVEPVVGSWELVGMGNVDGNVTRPARMTISINPSGTYDYQVWSDGDTEPFKMTGPWTVADGVLRIWPPDGASPKFTMHAYRIAWDGGTLVLQPFDEDDRMNPPMRFAHPAGSAS